MSYIPIPTTSPWLGQLMTMVSAQHFSDQTSLLNHILTSISYVEGNHEFLYYDVPPLWGEVVFAAIDEKIKSRKTNNTSNNTLRIRMMPSEIHNCIQQWMVEHKFDWRDNHAINAQEYRILNWSVGTTFELMHEPYSKSRKEPDFVFGASDHYLPTLVVESGWSELRDQFHKDIHLLLVGGNGAIKVVIIVKWQKLQGARVSGTVELFKRDRNGLPGLEQTVTIFPRPTDAITQSIKIRRADLFGTALLPGRNGDDILHLEIDKLRDHATSALGVMNLVPA